LNDLTEELAAIRERHANNGKLHFSNAKYVSYLVDDRAALLAEVDRLTKNSRAAESTYMMMADNLNRQDDEIDRLTAANERQAGEIERLRAALKNIAGIQSSAFHPISNEAAIARDALAKLEGGVKP